MNAKRQSPNRVEKISQEPNAWGAMRFLFLILLSVLSLQAADITQPIPALRLPDGRILKNAQLTVFRTLDVIIKHAGGTQPVRYEFLPDDIRSEAEKKRPGGPRFFAGDTAAEKTKVSGQVFINTRGAGAYKFSGVDVYAFPLEALQIWSYTNLNPVQLPKPIAITRTDADGFFSLTVPKDMPFFLWAQAQRMLYDGSIERFEWRAPSGEMKKLDQVQLSEEWRHEPRPVKIEKID